MTTNMQTTPPRPSSIRRAARLALVAVALAATFGATARADDHRGGGQGGDNHGGGRGGGDHRGGDHHDDHGHPGYGGGYYAPPPVVYGGPYYAPPPVVYGAGVGINLPGVSINIH
ncbi:MAG TPA: hypothetical protein VHU42_03270 [Rhodopila sp.]|nr:hypothetical protein [Rhodopila sp.]